MDERAVKTAEASNSYLMMLARLGQQAAAREQQAVAHRRADSDQMEE